jgi:predicted nucleic acid-binding protein
MADLLVDTDVCIDHLASRSRLPGRRHRLGYSVITRAELRAGATTGAQHEAIRRLLGTMREYLVDRQVADEAGRIRRQFGLRLPDAAIAATALLRSMTVHTRNVADFKRVPDLKIRPGG